MTVDLNSNLVFIIGLLLIASHFFAYYMGQAHLTWLQELGRLKREVDEQREQCSEDMATLAVHGYRVGEHGYIEWAGTQSNQLLQ